MKRKANIRVPAHTLGSSKPQPVRPSGPSKPQPSKPDKASEPLLAPTSERASEVLALLLSGHGANAKTLNLLTSDGLRTLPTNGEWLPYTKFVTDLASNFEDKLPDWWQSAALDVNDKLALSVGVCQQMNTAWFTLVQAASRDTTRMGYEPATKARFEQAYIVSFLQAKLADTLYSIVATLPWLSSPEAEPVDTQSLVAAVLRDTHRIRLIASGLADSTAAEYIDLQLKRWGQPWISDNLRRSQILGIHEFVTLT